MPPQPDLRRGFRLFQSHEQPLLRLAVFEVDEQGTIAAAVTLTISVAAGAPRMPPTPVPFDADRPFLFFLRDTDTGALLFAGRLTDAAAATAPSS